MRHFCVLGLHMPKKPVTREDAALAKHHLEDRIAFDLRHAREHAAAANAATGPLAEESRDYNKSHEADHRKDAAKARKKAASSYVKVGDLEQAAKKAGK